MSFVVAPHSLHETEAVWSEACCVISSDRDGRVISVARREDPGVRCLPGGSREIGEGARAAAVREFYEETGARIPGDDLVFVCVLYVAGVRIVVFADAGPLRVINRTLAEPDMDPRWSDLADLCDPAKHGLFALTSRGGAMSRRIRPDVGPWPVGFTWAHLSTPREASERTAFSRALRSHARSA